MCARRLGCMGNTVRSSRRLAPRRGRLGRSQNGRVPDHSTSKEADMAAFARTTSAAPYVRERRSTLHGGRAGGRRGFAVDASLIAADANKLGSKQTESLRRSGEGGSRRTRISRHARRCGVRRSLLSRRSSFPDLIRQPTGRAPGACFLRLRRQYLIDTDHIVIVDVEATRAIRQAGDAGRLERYLSRRDALAANGRILDR